jgi:hypothetical protein
MPLRLRRGNNATRASLTPAEGELIYVTDIKTVYVGDGTTVGGIPIANDPDLTTANVVETDNLYFTNARVFSNVTLMLDSTVHTNIALRANIADLTTANIVETDNLYFTNARARAVITAGHGIVYDSSNGNVSARVDRLTSPNLAYQVILDDQERLNLPSGSTLFNATLKAAAGMPARLQSNSGLITAYVNDTAAVIDANGNVFTFNQNGSVIFPDTTVQQTAWSNSYLTTANVVETSSLYYTNARVASNVEPLLYQVRGIANVAAPGSAGATGNVGEIRFDLTSIYICVAPSTWKKADLNTF